MVLLDREDRRHAGALRWAAAAEPIEIPPEVVSEALGVVQRRKGWASAKLMLDTMTRIPHMRMLVSSNPDEIRKYFDAANGRLTWVDATVVAWVHLRNGTPLCFDQAIVRACRGPEPGG